MIGLNRISTRNKTLIFIVILLLGFSFRLSYTHTRGFEVDLRLFARWARLVAREGLGAMYEQSPSAYPPLGAALLFPVGIMCPQCDMEADPVIRELYVLRWLCIGFDMLNAAILFRLGQKTRYAWAGLGAATLYLLFPIMALISGWWGQSDSWLIFFMLLAGVSLQKGKPLLAWGLLALAVLVKLQAVILFPVFVAGTWRWFGWRRLVWSGVFFMAIVGAFCIPVLIAGQLEHFVPAVTMPIRQDPLERTSHITLGGHNLWAGLARLKQIDMWGSYRHTVIPGITFHAASMSLLLFGLALAALRLFVNSSPKSIFAAMAISWLIFFQFAVGVGARYLLPVIVFALVVAVEHPRWWIPCIGLHLSTLFNLQDTIHHIEYPFLWIPLPGDIDTNIILTGICSLIVFGWFFTQIGHPQAGDGRFRANRLERGLAGVGIGALIVFLGTWLAQNASAQFPLERVGRQLNDSMRQEIEGGNDILAINWPEEITPTSLETGFLAPSTGIFQPGLDAMGASSATSVIYPPWAEMVDQVHHWNTVYHGYHTTTEMLVELILNAQRVVTVNMLTDAPQVWRLAEVSDLNRGIAPVARFEQHTQLVNARLESHAQMVFVYLSWNVTQPLSDDVTVFVHLLGPGGQLIAQADGDTVNNLIPLGQWYRYAEQVLEETRVMTLAPGAPSGAYTAAVGLYNRATLERLDVSCPLSAAADDNQRCENQAYLLKPIEIELGDN